MNPDPQKTGRSITLSRLARAVSAYVIVAAAAWVGVRIAALPPMVTLEHKTIDWRMRFCRPDPNFAGDVRVVLVDEAAMQGRPFRVPVPRGLVADIVSFLDRAGARVIGLDIFLKGDSLAADDEKLSLAIRAARRVVLVAPLREGPHGAALETPDVRFLRGSAGVGVPDLPVDSFDQRVRQMQRWFRAGPACYPSFAEAVDLCAGSADATAVPSTRAVQLPGGTMPKTDTRRLFIQYQGPPSTAVRPGGTIPVFDASAILVEGFPAAWFSNKVVLVGAGYSDNPDSHRTPFYSARHGYPTTPGVEIHANALATMRRVLQVRQWPGAATAGFVIALSLLLLMVERRSNTVVSGLAVVAALAVLTIASLVVFEQSLLALPMVPAACGAGLGFVSATVHRSLTEGRQKRWIKEAFQKYVSPDMVNLLVRHPEQLFVGGEEKELTILFSDIAGFSTLSERMTPAELFAWLNRYLDGMTQIILKHGGTLDKYQGDGIMAFWGAPLPQEDHARRAVAAALEMSRHAESVNRAFTGEGMAAARTRIGVSTGRVMVGNIGSRERFNYTIIGDEVNLASRLEGINKVFGTAVIAGETTWQCVRDAVWGRELDRLRVKGRETPVTVHEVMGLNNSPPDEATRRALAAFDAGLQAYRRRQWREAAAAFESVLKARPGDRAAAVYTERCGVFEKHPPQDTWDGVYTASEK
jgi:adenylate cyclase